MDAFITDFVVDMYKLIMRISFNSNEYEESIACLGVCWRGAVAGALIGGFSVATRLNSYDEPCIHGRATEFSADEA